MKTNRIFLFAILMCSSVAAMAGDDIKVAQNRVFRQTVWPEGFDDYQFYGNARIYNLKGLEVYKAPAQIKCIKANPTGVSVSVLYDNGKKASVMSVDINGEGSHRYRKVESPKAFCYSFDSRKIYIADATGVIYGLDSRKGNVLDTIPFGKVPADMVSSSNGYFIAANEGNNVHVINIEGKKIRTTVTENSPVLQVAFSEDASVMGVLTAEELKLYNTADFKVTHTISGLSNANAFVLHPENKYIAIASAASKVDFYNIYEDGVAYSFTEEAGGLTSMKFLSDVHNNYYLGYNAIDAMHYDLLKGLAPNYNQRMREELNARMMEWSKKQVNESDEEYKERISEEGVKKQRRLFANEISTSFAGDMLSDSEVSLGRYNKSKSAMEVNIGGMSSIYLNIPEDEISEFDNVSDLEFSDVQYGITKDDNFEVIFANVRNTKTGKTYTFNNLEQQSLDFIATDDNYVSFELMQKANTEDVLLKRIKKEVVAESQEKNLISDHTHINVNTNVMPDVDADGNRITNYRVEFDYNVESEYSIKEDFGFGKYLIEESHAAVSTLEIVVKAFKDEFSKYIKPGKKLIIDVTGSADAAPITGSIKYNGVYGTFDKEPYYLNGKLASVSVSPASGITENEQLAFMRSQGVRDYLDKNLPEIKQMDCQYRYHIEISKETGSQYRRVVVHFTFVDAF